VAYCHSRGVCHRDLKLENFCLEDDSDHARIKMIDFGLSAATATPMTDSVGTLYYVAPEVLRGRYDEKCDMWSMGVMAYVLLSGRAPFQGRNDRETVQLICRGACAYPAGRFSAAASDFIGALLQLDAVARPDAEAALAHPWLADADGAPAAPLEAWRSCRACRPSSAATR